MVSKTVTDRAEGLVTTKHLRGFKILGKNLHKELMKEGFSSSEARELVSYWAIRSTH